MTALITQLADFGSNYTAIGWLTLVVPVGLVGVVAVVWVCAFKRHGGAAGARGRKGSGKRS